MSLELDRVLIRRDGAQTPHAYEGLAPDGPWKVSGAWRDATGAERVVEISFATEEGAQAFAASELNLSGTWADPDGDGNYCIID